MPVLGFIILIFVLLGSLTFHLYRNASPEQIGIEGERIVHNILSGLPEEYHVMENVVLLKGKGTTQIDHIVVSKYGIFAIETKNYRGDIYGDDNRQQWTQIIRTDVTYRRKWYKTYTYVTKTHFYNPIKQSIGHVNGLKQNLSGLPYVPIIPIVVFTGEADLSNVKSNYPVIYEQELITTIQNNHKAYLSDNQVKTIVDCLSKKNVGDEIDNSTHVRSVYVAKEKYQQKINSGICPRCGSNLVPRKGRYGSFYGCSNYPNCNFHCTDLK